MVTRVAISQCPAGVGWAGSNVFGDWRLCGVSLALDKAKGLWLVSNGLAGVQEWEPESTWSL